MPIRYIPEHFDFPQRLGLPVLKELPPEFEEHSFLGPKTAWTKLDLNRKSVGLRMMVLCHHCGGWIPGRAHEHHINNLDGSRLCGRKGTEYYCPRCAKEICFSGVMS